jgi:AcrR family transcriptional regulator
VTGEHATTPPTAAPSVWERIAQRTPVPAYRPALTHALITETALRVADAEGIGAVSMRRLATELGVSAMTFYRYVSGKEDVFELMLDKVRTEVLLEDPHGDWRAVLRASALRFRTTILRHPWVVDMPGRILLAPTPGLLAVAEQNLAALDGLGLEIEQMADITEAVTAYTRASTHDEITRTRSRASEGWATRRDARDANTARLMWLLNAGDYPTYERFALRGASRAEDRIRFEFGLDCLLDGIAANLGIRLESPPG